MTNPASVMVPLDLVERAAKYAHGEELRAELAALLPKPDRARKLWERAFDAWTNARPGDPVAIIRAELGAPRPMTPEVADLISRLKDAEHAYRGTRSATACLQAADFLAAQFEVRHDR